MDLFRRTSAAPAPSPGILGALSAHVGSNAVRGAVGELANPATQAALAVAATGMAAALVTEATARAGVSVESAASDLGSRAWNSALSAVKGYLPNDK